MLLHPNVSYNIIQYRLNGTYWQHFWSRKADAYKQYRLLKFFIFLFFYFFLFYFLFFIIIYI